MSETKKLVFVSVPMNGRDEALIERQIQITKRKYLEENELCAKNVNFYDNLRGCRGVHFPNLKDERLGYLSRAILNLGKCDAAIFGKGWDDANGCRVEKMVCDLYGIKTYFYE